MSKIKKQDMIEVPDSWYYQSVETAELVGSYENQLMGMKNEIENLQVIIEMQGEILASQGIIPAAQAFEDFCDANSVMVTPEGFPLMEVQQDKKKES